MFTDGNCNTAPVKIDTTAEPNANIPNLAIGDVFNAGDYEVTVTRLTSGSQAQGWTGEGMVEQNLIAGVKIPMSVVFKNIKINSCYQYYNRGENGAVVHSKVDASWGSVVSVEDVLEKSQKLFDEIVDVVNFYQPSDNEHLKSLSGQINDVILDYENSPDFSTVEKEILRQNALLGQKILNEFLNCSSNLSRARVSSQSESCSVSEVLLLFKSINPIISVKTVDLKQISIGELQQGVARLFGERPTPQTFPIELGGAANFRNAVLTNYRSFSYEKLRNIFEHGTSSALSLGIATVLSGHAQAKILGNFYNSRYKTLTFDYSDPVSQDLKSNPTFINYHNKLISYLKNHLVIPTIGDVTFDNTVTAETFRTSSILGLINFSVPLEIPSYDFYGIMGGVQVVDFNLNLIQKTVKIPNNLLVPVKVPLLYLEKKDLIVEVNYSFKDWFGADFDDLYNPTANLSGVLKNLQESLKAFFVLQHDYGHKPFQTQINFKKSEVLISNR